MDLSYAGGSSDSDLTEADRARSTTFSAGNGQHRTKLVSSPTPLLGLVVRSIAPSSAEFHSLKGRAAIEEEISDLRKDET